MDKLTEDILTFHFLTDDSGKGPGKADRHALFEAIGIYKPPFECSKKGCTAVARHCLTDTQEVMWVCNEHLKEILALADNLNEPADS